jgi:hypothetical protein
LPAGQSAVSQAVAHSAKSALPSLRTEVIVATFVVPSATRVSCSDPLLFQAFSPARAPLRSQSNDAALLPCAAGDGVTGLALVEAVRTAESRLMLADNDDLF